MVCPAISSYSFGATALIFCKMLIHILWRCACSQDFDFHQIFSKWQVVGLSHFVRPSGYRYMVCPAISSYRIGATALIFCMMFIHIMEVDLFIISYGQVGGIMCVLQTHFIFRKITPNKTTLSIIIKCRAYFFSSFVWIKNSSMNGIEKQSLMCKIILK